MRKPTVMVAVSGTQNRLLCECLTDDDAKFIGEALARANETMAFCVRVRNRCKTIWYNLGVLRSTRKWEKLRDEWNISRGLECIKLQKHSSVGCATVTSQPLEHSH